MPARRLVAIVAAALAPLAAPSAARACGAPLEAVVTSERALVSFADGREEIVTSLALADAGPKAAVVYPVPGDAKVTAVEGPDLFAYLERVTAPPPKPASRSDADGAAGAAPSGGGVEVVGREVIGGYDVTRLRADDPRALQKFLDSEGYAMPAGAEPILSDYVEQGWRFVAVKLAAGSASEGSLKPLKIAFDSDEIVYPKRLDTLAEQPPLTKLFVVSDRRVETEGVKTTFAGEVARLKEQPPPEHKALFRGRYLTVLQQSAPAEQDFVLLPASSNAPAGSGVVAGASAPREAEDDDEDDDGFPTGSLMTALVGGAIGFGIAVLLARRRRRSQ